MNRTIFLVIFAVSFSVLLGSNQDAHAISVIIGDETSCESISGAVWSTSPDTCTITTDQTIASGETWTVNTGVTLSINSGVTITLQILGLISNFGTIENSGTINNNGIINNEVGGINNNVGGIINNNSDGAITNDDSISNTGTINNNGGNIINFSGTISNSGTINNNEGGTIFNNIGGIINNNSGGTITNTSGTITNDQGSINNFGTIENKFLGFIDNSDVINNGGTIINDGNINNVVTINNNNGGTIVNNLIINNFGTIDNQCGAVYSGNPPSGNPVNFSLCDNDGDGYFSDVDCNDNNSSINPGAFEIPGDNIDQECSGSDGLLSCGFGTIYSGNLCVPDPNQQPVVCGQNTMEITGICVPDLSQICGEGTIIQNMMCVAQSMGSMIGGKLLEINTVSLLVGAIGTNPVITVLVGMTIAGLSLQAIWFVHKRRKSENS